MKIVIATQNAPVYLASFLEALILDFKKNGHSLEGLLVLSPYVKGSFGQEIKNRYHYYGLLDFLKMSFFVLSNEFLSFLSNLMVGGRVYSAQNVTKKYNLKKLDFKKVNADEFVNYIKEQGIDLIISIAAPQIFRAGILSAPKFGCINYHTGLLPRYRGRQPLFWAMLNQEKEFGITIHQMDEKLDNGPIISQIGVSIEKNDSLHNLYLKALKVGPLLLSEAVQKIASDNFNYQGNNEKLAQYNGFPTANDAKLFRQKGLRFF